MTSILQDPDKGMYYSGAHHKKKGKIIKVHDYSPDHLAFLEHANEILSSLPKKRAAHINPNFPWRRQ